MTTIKATDLVQQTPSSGTHDVNMMMPVNPLSASNPLVTELVQNSPSGARDIPAVILVNEDGSPFEGGGGGTLPTGNENQVMGFSSAGQAVAKTLQPQMWGETDSSFPSSASVAILNSDESLSFSPASKTPEADSVAVRGASGRLQVSDGVAGGDAVTLSQLTNSNNAVSAELTRIEGKADNANTGVGAINDKVGAANGIAPLDASGFIPVQHLNVSGLSFKGGWNPTNNTPELVDGTGSVGDFYKATAAGTYNTGNAEYTYNVGDWIIYAAGVWQRIGSNESVASVNGKVGAVEITASDVGAKPASYTPSWSEISGKPTVTNTVNGQSGTVTLTASEVNARPDTWTPTWSQVGGKPSLWIKRGVWSPPIIGFYRIAGSVQSLANQTVTDLTIFNGSGSDPFNLKDGANIKVPSWAARARVIVNVRTEKMSDGANKHLWVAAYHDDVRMGDAYAMGTGSLTAPAVSLTTGMHYVNGAGNLNVKAWQNNGAALNTAAASNYNSMSLTVEFFEFLP